MNGITGYILAVMAAAVAAAILRTLAGSGPMGNLVKMLAGVFVTLTVLSPLVRLELPDPRQWIGDYADAGKAAAAVGESLANDAADTFIKEQVEAYILDKAARYGTSVRVAVSLDPEGIPAEVTLTGDVSAYAKARLMRIMETDLGLGEEVQHWCG